jgi:hypothetical protein
MNARRTDDLWTAVQAALDAGREPLEDPGVLAFWRTASEAQRDEVSRLLARLEALPSAPVRTAPRARWRRWTLPVAVAAALLAWPFATLWSPAPRSEAHAAPSAIYEAHLSVERRPPPTARLERATRAVERHFTWNVAGESGRLEVR